MSPRSRFARLLLAGSIAAVLGGCGAARHITTTATTTTRSTTTPAVSSTLNWLPSKAECPYTALQISILASFDQLVGRTLNCAQVYANTPANWAQFEKPWFIDYATDPNLDWSAWATAPGTERTLVITLNLFPSSIQKTDWLAAGAAGDFVSEDKVLAQNLVAAGLGHSIIRLAPEMNGTWYDYSLGTTKSSWAQWITFWDKTVTAMRSVPGADFAFDWCINLGYRTLPLTEIFPGSKYVDIIGMDAYDIGNSGTNQEQRWEQSYYKPDGIRAVLRFARSENRPVSFPEWGVAPAKYGGGGDSAPFVNGLATVIAENPVVYESYFYKDDFQTQLAQGPDSLAAYRKHFGADGDSVDSGTNLWSSATSDLK